MKSAEKLLDRVSKMNNFIIHLTSPWNGVKQSLDPDTGGYEVRIDDEVISYIDGNTLVFRDGSSLTYEQFYSVIEKIDYSVHIPSNYTGD